MSELDPRKQMILRAVVFEYVSAAEPVGSEYIAEKYALGVKSATIRNELADLSDLGYLEQPHTSAGRVPSDLGYRYFVDRLMAPRGLEKEQKQAVQSAAEEGELLQDLLRDTTRALSRLTHQLSAATIIRDANLTVKHAVLSALGPHQALLVVILSNGHVENRMIECPPGLTLTEIGSVNETLAKVATGKSLRWFSRNKAPTGGGATQETLAGAVWASFRSISRELNRSSVTTEGAEFLFGQPEFKRDAAALNGLVDLLQQESLLSEALNTPTDADTTITIGKENRSEELRHLSIVRRTFFVGESEAGVIAVIGPRRMDYDQSVSFVGYAARALSEALTRYFG
ncbi:MAG TPA: heat-inducible transcriptional repressor HrcA [Fimbriimonadaceae bacterium]|nr:heat-inducible transcriptional repressor HrcA [Fimbriimonadaceae bacterium]